MRAQPRAFCYRSVRPFCYTAEELLLPIGCQESYQRTMLSHQKNFEPNCLGKQLGGTRGTPCNHGDITRGEYGRVEIVNIPVGTSSDNNTRLQVTGNGLNLYNQEARSAFHQREAEFQKEAQQCEVIAPEGSENRLRAAAKQFGSDKRSGMHTLEPRHFGSSHLGSSMTLWQLVHALRVLRLGLLLLVRHPSVSGVAAIAVFLLCPQHSPFFQEWT